MRHIQNSQQKSFGFVKFSFNNLYLNKGKFGKLQRNGTCENKFVQIKADL